VRRVVWIVILVVAATGGSSDDGAEVVDWSAWDAVLRGHVADGVVDYDGIAREPGLRVTIDAIADARLDGHGRDARLAFLINAYNVLAIKGILDGRSPRTAFGKLRYFYRDRYTVAGETLSLNALEHDRLRPFGEPRIHFAIVCASASCPPLRSEAYLSRTLDVQLDDNARRFLNDPARNRIDPERKVAEISKIFKWFEEDFEAGGGVLPFISRFVDDEAAAEALRTGGLEIHYLDYDWSLNGSFSGDDR